MSLALITGGAGFVGVNTADRLLCAGERVRVLDDLSRPGVERNLSWLQRRHGSRLEVDISSLTDRTAVARSVRDVDTIFHFAAQVAVTTSLDDPARDAEVNIRGTINLLEAARTRSHLDALIFTSTNKVYGALGDIALRQGDRGYHPVSPVTAATGIGEDRPLTFCTPYGCSKGSADQYVLDYAGSYRLPTVVFRMSCIYGPHQFGTEDQGWVAHFVNQALRREPITVYGNGKQVRDILYVSDLVDALLTARDRAPHLAGRAFNIGGGPGCSVSVLQVIDVIAGLTGESPEVRLRPWRSGDQRYYVSDTRAFSGLTGWAPSVPPQEGIECLHGWMASTRARVAA